MRCYKCSKKVFNSFFLLIILYNSNPLTEITNYICGQFLINGVYVQNEGNEDNFDVLNTCYWKKSKIQHTNKNTNDKAMMMIKII